MIIGHSLHKQVTMSCMASHAGANLITQESQEAAGGVACINTPPESNNLLSVSVWLNSDWLNLN